MYYNKLKENFCDVRHSHIIQPTYFIRESFVRYLITCPLRDVRDYWQDTHLHLRGCELVETTALREHI